MKQPTLARAWVFVFSACTSPLTSSKPRTRRTAVEAAAQAKLHEAIALASDNTMFLHLHTSVIGMLREYISIDVAG